jgi:hypothetical protein
MAMAMLSCLPQLAEAAWVAAAAGAAAAATAVAAMVMG